MNEPEKWTTVCNPESSSWWMPVEIIWSPKKFCPEGLKKASDG